LWLLGVQVEEEEEILEVVEVLVDLEREQVFL
jgi:hypothetical protein